jgi:hypothetical protein
MEDWNTNVSSISLGFKHVSVGKNEAIPEELGKMGYIQP